MPDGVLRDRYGVGLEGPRPSNQSAVFPGSAKRRRLESSVSLSPFATQNEIRVYSCQFVVNLFLLLFLPRLAELIQNAFIRL